MTGTYEAILPILEDSFETLAVRNNCPITAAAFLNIVADLFAILVLSSSKSLAPHTCCTLNINAGERTESFLLPTSAMEEKHVLSCSTFALHKSPLRRYTALAKYVRALKSRPQRFGGPATPCNFSKADADALRIVDTVLEKMSDENDLEVLRACSARELRWAADITQCSDNPIGAVSKNRRQFDFTLALQGYALGERYAFDATIREVQVWIGLLSKAGAEYSVSSSRWCTNDLLTLDTRIFVLGPQQCSQ